MNDTDLATEREETIDWLVDLGVERTGAVTAVDSLIQVASRLSQPVQVEVTDEQLIDLWWTTCNDEWAVPDSVMVKFGRATLEAALGGGDHE